MRYSESRINRGMIYAQTPSFVKMCKVQKNTHFTRNRKMPLNNLMLTVLFRKGLTLHMELRAFKKTLNLKETISKVGYLKQRLKLNPAAFLSLARHHARNFYDDGQMVKKFKGYLILAVDGSAVNVPTTIETLSTYGNASRDHMKPQAQLTLSSLFDTMNKMVIDCTINRNNCSEREQALLHIDNMREITGGHLSIVITDRGYPSGEFFIDLLEREQKFIVRLPSTMFKQEQQQMESDDCLVNIAFDKTRINPHRGTSTAEKLARVGSIELRFVRLLLPSGEYEYLATNVSQEEFSTLEMGVLYGMRWGIETAYDDLKNKLNLENFTGRSPILLEQDIYATVYICNVMNDIILEAQQELEQKRKYAGKHDMAINKNIAIGVIKEELIHVILEKDHNKRKKRMEALIEEIKKNLLPVRKGRRYPRNKGNYAGNYSNTRKRSY
ncbi:IS4 family transposase [Paenibacillus alba]|uniref:IS4 family transposase n=1 Tax=Paenibacillus alba TaxID=1197127 RepID=A0ABU6GEK9_9BACL|nr:IS4 family transposase [Paenibacillus alba]MEC0232668.1 IS4 family transposase [Paenibacillus alba]